MSSNATASSSGTPQHASQSGPKTAPGKAIAARNATTHGLFARDIVLTQLGEDPKGYETLHLELAVQLCPSNLLEKHYVEKIAAASWRLRRLHRWQAQLFEDETLTEDERMLKLDRVMRHETALHRQIDTAVRMLAREVPPLFEARARKEALVELGATERDCRADYRTDAQVAERTHENLCFARFAPDHSRFDNTHTEPETCQPEICQNEPAPLAPEGIIWPKGCSGPAAVKNCQNEPDPISLPPPPELGAGGLTSPYSEGEVARNEPEGVPTTCRESSGYPPSPALWRPTL